MWIVFLLFLFIFSVQGVLENDNMNNLVEHYLTTHIEKTNYESKQGSQSIPRTKFARFKIEQISKQKQDAIGEESIEEFANQPVNIRFLSYCHHALDIVFTPSDEVGKSTFQFFWKEEYTQVFSILTPQVLSDDVLKTVNSEKIEVEVWFIQYSNPVYEKFLVKINGVNYASVPTVINFYNINTIRVDTENLKYTVSEFTAPDDQIASCCGIEEKSVLQCPCSSVQ